jgi:MoaA/NifB/PqqE/SkfB family radical SAM enzyme
MGQASLQLSAPLHIEVALTSVCELRCDYCSAMPFDGKLIPTERMLKLIEEIQQLKVFSLLLSGGEPTLHPEFLTFLSACARSSIELTVNSNGINLSDFDFASEVNKVHPKAIIAVSLDSSDNGINDLHRGSGGRKAQQAISNLCELGQPIYLSTVMTGDNFGSAETLIDQFFPQVKVFRFFPRVPRSKEEVLPSSHHYWRLLDAFFSRLTERAAHSPELKILLPYQSVPLSRQGIVFDEIEGCCCPFTKSYINSSLDVFPCYYSANKDTSIGNLLDNSFHDIWNGLAAKQVRQIGRKESLCALPLLGSALPHRYIDVP